MNILGDTLSHISESETRNIYNTKAETSNLVLIQVKSHKSSQGKAIYILLTPTP